VREETIAEVEPGALLWVVEYEPQRNQLWAGPVDAHSFIFAARRKPGDPPRLPRLPDRNQTAVRWVPLAELEQVELLPHIDRQILHYAASGETGPTLLEEPLQPQRVQKYIDMRQQLDE
jgi:8-oxo-dGTP diphosphatase